METQVTLKRVFQKGLITFELPKDEVQKESMRKVLIACHDRYSDFVTLTLSTPYQRRSTGKPSQNHHLNGHIVQICNVTGNEYDIVKHCIKMTAVEQFGYPYTTIEGFIAPKGERNCSKEECAKLIEAAHFLAAKWGIPLKEIKE